MVLLKTTVIVLLAVAFVSAGDSTAVKLPKDHAEKKSVLSPEPPITQSPSGSDVPTSSTTQALPTTSTTIKPNPTTTNTPNVTTTTHTPNVTTTHTPDVTTTTLRPNVTTTTPSPNVTTTTPSPNVTTTTLSPNVTTPLPPTPEPSPARSWDGPSFLGGMVLAFGIVAVGFVGYRFFYLGRGGAYHTL